MPMYIGLQRLIHRDLKAKIKSGVIYEKDSVKLEKRSNGPDVFELSSDPFGDKGNLVGAWCYVEVPGRDGEVTLMSRLEIEQVRAKSRAMHEGAPWNQWYSQMAEKSVIKRAMKRVRYLIPRDSRLAQAMAEAPAENVVTAEPVIVQEADVVAQMEEVVKEEESKPEPKKPTKKAEAPKPAKVEEQKVEQENYFDGDFEL